MWGVLCGWGRSGHRARLGSPSPLLRGGGSGGRDGWWGRGWVLCDWSLTLLQRPAGPMLQMGRWARGRPFTCSRWPRSPATLTPCWSLNISSSFPPPGLCVCCSPAWNPIPTASLGQLLLLTPASAQPPPPGWDLPRWLHPSLLRPSQFLPVLSSEHGPWSEITS